MITLLKVRCKMDARIKNVMFGCLRFLWVLVSAWLVIDWGFRFVRLWRDLELGDILGGWAYSANQLVIVPWVLVGYVLVSAYLICTCAFAKGGFRKLKGFREGGIIFGSCFGLAFGLGIGVIVGGAASRNVDGLEIGLILGLTVGLAIGVVIEVLCMVFGELWQ
jgi:hypothetical protein